MPDLKKELIEYINEIEKQHKVEIATIEDSIVKLAINGVVDGLTTDIRRILLKYD
ncbi:hypothetical protein LCGC14_0514930 [marine sediment metagenome]|uniref:Uncharacterized protein n=1 Tax=marine sediment metagenome TaxID=412755 RepID=A0A0F9SII5_9ZZZZ